ncbi:MAG TPA: nucleotide exchange factor GrpE [Acidobacteriota bacterium]|nr:nucleotide exchange factor GrpE [Acidobacteriota bacterium]
MEHQEKQQNPDNDTLDFPVIDKRKFLNPDMTGKETVSMEEKPRYPTYVEELIAKMEATERKFQEKKQQIDEEIARTRTRLEGDFERRMELEKQKIALPFLEVLDNLLRAVAAAERSESVDHLLEGVKMTADLFNAKLKSIGVEPVETLDRPFDPNLAEAIGTVMVDDSDRDGIVLEEVQPGYAMGGQLLRPARVRVGSLK